jgi:hypothetical protein
MDSMKFVEHSSEDKKLHKQAEEMYLEIKTTTENDQAKYG